MCSAWELLLLPTLSDPINTTGTVSRHPFQSDRPRRGRSLLLPCALLCLGMLCPRARAQIYVAEFGSGSIGEFNTDGTTVNASLVTGLNGAGSVAVGGSDLFATNAFGGTVGEYDAATGATVNAALITGPGGFADPNFVTVAGSNVYVTNESTGTIGEYTTGGATVNAALVSGLNSPFGLAVSGSDLWVANGGVIGEYDATTGAAVATALVSGFTNPIGVAVFGSDLYVTDAAAGTIGEFNAFTGAAINASLVSGLNSPVSVAVLGADLFVSNQGAGTIGEYDATTGAVVNAALVTGLSGPSGLTVAGVPEPSSWAALAGLTGLGFALLRRRRSGA